MNRREFLGGAAATLVAGCGTDKTWFGGFKPAKVGDIKSMLIHLGTRMWSDRNLQDKMVFDEKCWNELTDTMAKRGLNQVVVDLAEGMVFPSHPELAVKGAWTPERMRDEIRRLHAMGIEVIPKMNFSTGHDTWLGVYHRMVSSPKYYEVCADLIRDCAEIFETPRFLHMGYDEENAGQQAKYDMCVIRQGELWWHDFLWFVGQIEKAGMRPWMWGDYAWAHHDEFVKRCPKGVLLSNWYYRQWFDYADPEFPKFRQTHLRTFDNFEKAGFDQLPCGSNWGHKDNLKGLVRYCREKIAPERLYGFMAGSWEMTVPYCQKKNMECLELFAQALKQ